MGRRIKNSYSRFFPLKSICQVFLFVHIKDLQLTNCFFQVKGKEQKKMNIATLKKETMISCRDSQMDDFIDTIKMWHRFKYQKVFTCLKALQISVVTSIFEC